MRRLRGGAGKTPEVAWERWAGVGFGVPYGWRRATVSGARSAGAARRARAQGAGPAAGAVGGFGAQRTSSRTATSRSAGKGTLRSEERRVGEEGRLRGSP